MKTETIGSNIEGRGSGSYERYINTSRKPNGGQEKEERRTLTCLGGNYWGTVGSGTFATHQRATLTRVPQLIAQPLACWQRVQGKGKERRKENGVEPPRAPKWATKC